MDGPPSASCVARRQAHHDSSAAHRPYSDCLSLPESAPALDPRAPAPPVGRLRTVLSLPADVWLGTLLVFYLTFIADTYQTFYPIYAGGIGVSVGTIGLLKVVHSIASTSVRFAGAGLFRIVPVAFVNHTMTISMALALISLAFVTGDIVVMVMFAILGACRGLLRVTSATMVAEERSRPGVSAGLVSDQADLSALTNSRHASRSLSLPSSTGQVRFTRSSRAPTMGHGPPPADGRRTPLPSTGWRPASPGHSPAEARTAPA